MINHTISAKLHSPTPPLLATHPMHATSTVDAPEFRGCHTIQNHNKKKHIPDVISKNKHPISRNI